jgi:hypothetical protein
MRPALLRQTPPAKFLYGSEAATTEKIAEKSKACTRQNCLLQRLNVANS